MGGSSEVSEQSWMKQMPMEEGLKVERVLHTRFENHTKGNEYLEFLVKRKDRPKEDSTWLSVAALQRGGRSIEELMRRMS